MERTGPARAAGSVSLRNASDMADFPELLILRHGETEWNRDGRMQGALDSPLTPMGEAQARAQNKILRAFKPFGWPAFVSTQGRAQSTARIALSGVCTDFASTDELVEIGVGRWSGKKRADIVKQLPADVRIEETPDGAIALYEYAPGGEGFEGLRERVIGFLAGLPGPSILVTHGITSRMLRAVILGLNNDQLGELPGGQGVVYHMKDGTQTRLE